MTVRNVTHFNEANLHRTTYMLSVVTMWSTCIYSLETVIKRKIIQEILIENLTERKSVHNLFSWLDQKTKKTYNSLQVLTETRNGNMSSVNIMSGNMIVLVFHMSYFYLNLCPAKFHFYRDTCMQTSFTFDLLRIQLFRFRSIVLCPTFVFP